MGMADITLTGIIRIYNPGGYTLHTDSGKNVFNSLQEAVTKGREILEDHALKRIRSDHVDDPLIEFNMEEKKVSNQQDKSILLETVLQVRATGRPSVSKSSTCN
jgi:hypothetical protein